MSSIQLNWNAISPPGSTYTVLRNGAAVAAGLSVTSYLDGTVSDNTTYTYAVFAINANGPGLRSNTASATTPPAQVQGLSATPVSSSQINLSWAATPGATSYTVRRGGSVVGTPAGTSFPDTGLSASTLYSYTVAANGAGGQGAQSASASATTQAGSQAKVWNPGVHYTVGNLGGVYGTIAQAISDWTTQCTNVANKNASKIVKGFQVCVPLRLIFPTTQGDWAHSQGITLFTQAFQMLNGLANGPYSLSVSVNMVANTYGNQTITAATAQGFVPSWWYNNATYGPTGGGVNGGNFGGVYWDNSAAGHLTSRFWNAACMGEVAQVWSAIYAALEPQGMHIYRVEPTMEISGAAAMISAGMTDAEFTTTWSTFAANMRTGLPNSLFAMCLTFPRSQSDTPGMLEAVLTHDWALTNYDGANMTVPADLPTGSTRSDWGDLAFCGQTAVNGPVVSKNYKQLGFDHHNNVVADELGHGTTAVPNAVLGTGRIPDILALRCEYVGSSHLYIYSDTFTGPPCNTTGTYSGQPANYKYPASGATVTQTNSIAYLAALNANSFLDLTYPAAYS